MSKTWRRVNSAKLSFEISSIESMTFTKLHALSWYETAFHTQDLMEVSAKFIRGYRDFCRCRYFPLQRVQTTIKQKHRNLGENNSLDICENKLSFIKVTHSLLL